MLAQNEKFQSDAYWRDYIPFYEYFHGDTGAGVGASHQTGWTGLVAKMIDELYARQKETGGTDDEGTLRAVQLVLRNIQGFNSGG